jgi:putative solute:sodium symporter small subunit
MAGLPPPRCGRQDSSLSRAAQWRGFARPARRQARAAEPAPGGSKMIERNERKAYWRHTKTQMLASLLPFLLAMIVLPLYADALNNKRVLGIPLGYFLACHGLIVIAFVTVAVFVNRQDAIDRWHGAHEDF